MQVSDIPHEDRVLFLAHDYAMIWPFRNIPRGEGPYELFLDNNALARASWLKALAPEMRNRIIVAPALALAEQWLSNPLFRDHPEARIDQFLAPFIDAGVRFPPDFAEKQALSLASNDAAWRTQWMLVFLYVVLLYRITKARKGDGLPDELLDQLKHQDVPMFSGCIMLCCLASYLRSHQSARLVADGSPAFSYLDSFVSLHGKAKGEAEFDEKYIRNRAGDLSTWCSVGALFHNGFQPAGEPVIVTQDKVLSRLVFRCFPAYLAPDGKMAFTFDDRAFERHHAASLSERICAVVGAARPPTSRAEQLKRLERLREHVTFQADSQLTTAVNQVWQDWLEPGYHEAFR